MVESDSELGLGERSLLVWPTPYSPQGGIKSGGRDSDAIGGTGRVNSRQRKAKSACADSSGCPPGWFILVRLVDDSFRMLFTASEVGAGELSVINYQLSIINGDTAIDR